MKLSFESTGSFEKVAAWLSNISGNTPNRTLQQIAKEGEKALAANTPKNTGETASGWTSEITTKGDISEIAWKNVAHPESRLNVAKLIELGHGTRTGGYVSPRPYIKQSIKPIFDTASDRLSKELIK